MKNHLLFKKIISSAIRFFISDEEYLSIHKCPIVPKIYNYLPYNERKILYQMKGVSFVDLINKGASVLSITDTALIDKMLAYETSDNYRALLGFSYLYKSTAKGSLDIIAAYVKANPHYIRQILSEYTVISRSLLVRISEVYGIRPDTLLEIGTMFHAGKTHFEIYEYYRKNVVLDRVIYIPPCVPYITIDWLDQKNISLLFSLSINAYMSEHGLWKHKRPAKVFNVKDISFYKMLYFADNPDYVSTYDMHLSIAKNVHIDLADLYALGIDAFADYMSGKIKGKKEDRLSAKASIIDDKKKIMLFLSDIITKSDKKYTKANISEFIGFDQSHLSRVSKGVMPSSEMLTNLLNAFDISIERVLAVYSSNASAIEQFIKGILVSNCPINAHLNKKQNKDVTACTNLFSIIAYVEDVYGQKGINTWLSLAGIGRSCIRRMSNTSTCVVSNRTIRMLSIALGIDPPSLLALGEELKQNKELSANNKIVFDSLK